MKKIHLGDKGETSLIGSRVSKDELRVEAYGTVDELNSFLGFVRSITTDQEINKILEQFQNKLFVLGSELAAPQREKVGMKLPSISDQDVKDLDKVIENAEKELKPLTRFILPSGTSSASALHVVRTICRRAERKIVSLSKKEKLNENMIPFINRMSDALFSLARLENKRSNVEEKEWKI